MKEKVSLGITCKITTILVFIIVFLPTIILLGLQTYQEAMMIFLICSVVLLLCIPMSPKSVELTDNALVIHRYAGKKTICFGQIASVEPYSKKGISDIRLFGIGGVLGYTGTFYNRRLGNYISYVGNYNETFLITLKSGKKYLVSCQNHLNVISALQKRLQEK